jgi:SPP1 gp7 family putative phage head morphogenesis protein
LNVEGTNGISEHLFYHMTKNVYDKKQDDDLIDEALALALYLYLLKGFDNPSASIKQNLKDFSVFKNFHNKKDLIDLLKANPDTTFEEFVTLAKPINDEFNKYWLETEYKFVKESSLFNKEWKQWKKDGVKYLQFVTMRDDRVRPAHAELDGITKPFNDEFWDTHQTPLDWNCRCKIIAVDEAPITNSKEHDDVIEPMFKNNIAKSGVVFTELHPYFQHVQSATKEKLYKLATTI